jgi:hypothetical protein
MVFEINIDTRIEIKCSYIEAIHLYRKSMQIGFGQIWFTKLPTSQYLSSMYEKFDRMFLENSLIYKWNEYILNY